MAVKISITKALEKKIRDMLESAPVMEKHGTTIRQLVSAIDDGRDKLTRKAEQQGGLSPQDVVRTIKGVLGTKAYLPPNPGAAFYGYTKSRTKFLNVSLQDIERAAVHVRETWKLPTSIEWIIRKLDQILDEAADRDSGVATTDPSEVWQDQWQLNTGRE